MIKNFLKKTFKIVSYGIFHAIYGKIKHIIETHEDDRIKVEIVNIEKNLEYKIYNITNGRLYTDRIQDTAILLDNKIIKGPSFQLRKTHDSKIYNSNIENNIVFEKGTPRKLRKLNGSVLSLLTGGGGNNNYWHWLFDVLPRIALCNKIINLNDIDYFLLPDHLKQFQKETLDYLNIPMHKRLSSKKFRHVQANKLIVTDHPVVIDGDATKAIMNMPGWISQWLKDNFITKNTKGNKNNSIKIYIDRSTQTTTGNPQRLISNENEVKEFLLKKNFIPVKLHEETFIDQVKLFNNADCIIGLHGGGFANLVFCKPETKIIELKSSNAGVPIENLAKKNNLNYKSIAVVAKQLEKYNFPNQQGSIEIEISRIDKLL